MKDDKGVGSQLGQDLEETKNDSSQRLATTVNPDVYESDDEQFQLLRPPSLNSSQRGQQQPSQAKRSSIKGVNI